MDSFISGYSAGSSQIVHRLFSQTRLNSYMYNALIGYLTGPNFFYAKVFKEFLFSFVLYCVVLKSVYIHFFFLYTILFVQY